MTITKLTIIKYEDYSDFKTLSVTIDGDSTSAKTTFGEWTTASNQSNRKNAEKFSRLVVKIVSGDELNKLNLDLCAKEVDNKYLCENRCRQENSFLNKYIINDHIDINENKIHKDSNKITDFDDADPNFIPSPLEHSLEKVKENNARIMQNIHLLNRTLNYTKKKEINDIVMPKSMPSHSCNTCGKCFVYETGLKRHYSVRHAFSEILPRWQVVWTCIQCFQVWPCQDQARNHALVCCKTENPDCVREIKASSLLQCEFCEIVFTSIPRLLRHYKTHTTASNYECNACGRAFLSYKTAEQHWLVCPWLKVYYNFSLPKLLLCNACDRKFRNYVQLYNHRYKFEHFITKVHNSKGSTSVVGKLVYQCEICGQWYISPLLLKAHRTQNHPQSDDSMPKLENHLTQVYNTDENEFHID